MKKYTTKIVILISLLTCFVSAGIVSAQQVSLSISPPIIEATMKPGKSIMVAYNVKNSGDPVILSSRVVNFEPRDNLGNLRLKDDLTGPVRFSLDNADIKLGDSFFLNTGATQQLLLRIRLPESVPDGDHYYSLLVETEPPTHVEGKTSPRAKAAIATNILITITESGIVEIKPKITLFDTLSKWKIGTSGKEIKIFDSFDKIPVVLYVENRGNNKITPNGKISLRGTLKHYADFNVIPKNILSSSQRLLETESTSNQSSASASIDNDGNQPVTLILSGFFVGKYSLSSEINFGENSPTVYASTSFIAIPFRIIGGLIVIIFITIFLTKKFSSNDDTDDDES